MAYWYAVHPPWQVYPNHGRRFQTKRARITHYMRVCVCVCVRARQRVSEYAYINVSHTHHMRAHHTFS